MSTVFSSNLEPSCGVVFSNIFSLIRNMTTFKRPPSPQIRLSEVSGVEVADRRGYLTLELETGKDGVLLLRCLPAYFVNHLPVTKSNGRLFTDGCQLFN